jgi:hypothetical protein
MPLALSHALSLTVLVLQLSSTTLQVSVVAALWKHHKLSSPSLQIALCLRHRDRLCLACFPALSCSLYAFTLEMYLLPTIKSIYNPILQ